MTKEVSGMPTEGLSTDQANSRLIHRAEEIRRAVTPYLFMLPALLPVFGLLLYPLVYVFRLSLQEHVLYRPYEHGFIGLKNFAELSRDPHFWQSLNASIIWVVGSIAPQFVFGLILALLLNQQFRGRGLYRAIVISPWAIGGVLTGIFWTWLFNAQVGPINDLLLKSGLIAERIPWKITALTAFFTVLVANVWRGIPFFAIMMLAALQSIPGELYEAATVDGAGSWQRFRFVTLPLIKNQAILSTMLRSIWVFGNIDLIWTMTEGAPAGATRTLAVYVLHTAYKFSDFGYGAAIAVIIFLISLVFAITYLWMGRFTQELEAEVQG
jgi:multiple sugar transport system permease protein